MRPVITSIERGSAHPVSVVGAALAAATAGSPIVVQAAARRWGYPRSRPHP
ncbi:hypothetical protein [Kitasatospora sp. KL5]|uniref:hypothetical protein n=1 Tax=Kitasatospora sp. KL5 TaxID=3425125 RepID=UPI003D6F7FC7